MNTLHPANLQPGQSVSGVFIAKADLSEKTLPRFMANDASFSEIDFRRADLTFTRWRLCRFHGVNFDGIKASSLVMRQCRLLNCSARCAQLDAAALENSELPGTDFTGTILTKASLIESNFDQGFFCDADLESATLDDSSLRGVNFQRAKLVNARVRDADLRGADFRSAILKNTSFRDADLRGADFTGAIIGRTDFRGADTRGAQFDEPVGTQPGMDPGEMPLPAELVTAVAPLVANLLNSAGKKGMIDESTWQSELEETLRDFGAGPLDMKLTAEWDKQIGDWLRNAGEIGVDQLVDALKSDSEEAPPEVAKLLEGLGRDLGLKPDVSSEEVLSALLVKLRKT